MGSTNINKQIFLFTLFLIIICLPSTLAEEYYADLTIDVDSSGFVTIDGVTNYPDLLVENTDIYTSKKQSYWLLNITKEDIFNDFVYALNLPEGSSINYIKSSGFIRIEETQGNLIVKGFGENESLSLQVQYQIEKSTESFKFDYIFLILILGIIILIIFLLRFLIKEKAKTQELKDNGYDFKGLNQRQKQIMRLLIDRNTPLTQTDIQRELNIPKAAVSRNIRGLELKGLIEKEQIGMSNLIRIKKT